ncbi:sugar kinase [Geminicoccaceae bacterium 1502E]|nr:sugar kinase [Geminicoccaceae bacterium 1502E]
MALDLVCLGEPMVEFNQTERDQPQFLMGHGGDTSNCAIAAARHGLKVGYLTRLGDDAMADSLMKLWREERVDASRVVRDPAAPTGIYFVTHGPEGHAFTYYRAGSAASRMRPEDLPHDYLLGARALHLSGISQSISDSACDTCFAAIEAARRENVLVSYDTNLRLKLWPLDRARAIIHATAPRVDILRPGLDDARQLTGLEDADEIVDFYLRLGAPLVALTLGSEGALVATADRRQRFAARKVESVDATGAGDAFDGAFLAEYLRTRDPFGAGEFANAAAALATTGYGAVAPLPRRGQVESFLAGRSGDA